jgi:hypothetical protein
VVLGTWGDDQANDHVTFSCQVRAEGAGLIDSTVAVKGEAAFFGRKLTRGEALEHPLLPELWPVVETILLHDPTVKQHMYGS